jgi:hypothetical protein
VRSALLLVATIALCVVGFIVMVMLAGGAPN